MLMQRGLYENTKNRVLTASRRLGPWRFLEGGYVQEDHGNPVTFSPCLSPGHRFIWNLCSVLHEKTANLFPWASVLKQSNKTWGQLQGSGLYRWPPRGSGEATQGLWLTYGGRDHNWGNSSKTLVFLGWPCQKGVKWGKAQLTAELTDWMQLGRKPCPFLVTEVICVGATQGRN